MRKLSITSLAIVLILALGVLAIGCEPDVVDEPIDEPIDEPVDEPVDEPAIDQITVGSKGFTEQLIIGEMLAQLLEDRGYNVNLVDGLSTPALREGQEAGDLDVIAEYTGTAWMVHFGREYTPGVDNNELYQMVKDIDEDEGIIWLDPIWNDNGYYFAAWPEFVDEHGVRTLSELAELYREKDGMIDTSVTIEFEGRPDGLVALEDHYDYEVDRDYLLAVEAGLTLVALDSREVDVGMVFGTDSNIEVHNWHVFSDDQAFFPPYDMTPSVRAEILEADPRVADIINELMATFPGGGQPATIEIVAESQRLWQMLNYKVDFEGMMPDEAAREYLLDQGLIEQ